MRFALAAILLTACATDGENGTSPDPSTTELPEGCDYEVSLNGSSGNATPSQVGPVTVDAVGKNVCLHLDATHNLVAAHFAASSEYWNSETAPLALSLHDMEGATLRDGWDVTVSETNPMTFENLEWDAPLGSVTDAILWIHARDAAASSTVSVALFEPLE